MTKLQDSQGTVHEVTVDHDLDAGRSEVRHRGHLILALEYNPAPDTLAQMPKNTDPEMVRQMMMDALNERVVYELQQRTGPEPTPPQAL